MPKPKKDAVVLSPRGKAAANLPKDVVEEFDTLSPDEIKEKLVTLARYQEEVTVSKADNEDITSFSEKLKEAKAPFTEKLKDIKARQKYLVMCLEESGA